MDGIRQLAIKPKVGTSTSGSQGQNALIEAVIVPNGRRLPLVVPAVLLGCSESRPVQSKTEMKGAPFLILSEANLPPYGNVDSELEDRAPPPSTSTYRSDYPTLGVTFVGILEIIIKIVGTSVAGTRTITSIES